MKEKIESELLQAQKDRDELKVSTLRMLVAAMQNEEIAVRTREGTSRKLSDEEIQKLVATEIKKRKEAIEGFTQGGNVEMADKEKKEMETLFSYMPEQMSEEELNKVVSETITEVGATGLQDFGKVMGAVMGKVKGKATGDVVSVEVKKQLGN